MRAAWFWGLLLTVSCDNGVVCPPAPQPIPPPLARVEMIAQPTAYLQLYRIEDTGHRVLCYMTLSVYTGNGELSCVPAPATAITPAPQPTIVRKGTPSSL